MFDEKITQSGGAGGGSPLIYKKLGTIAGVQGAAAPWIKKLAPKGVLAGGQGVKPPVRKQVKLALHKPGIKLGQLG